MGRYIKNHELRFLAYPKSKPRKQGYYFVIREHYHFPDVLIPDIAMWLGKNGWEVCGMRDMTIHVWAKLPETKEWKELLQLEA